MLTSHVDTALEQVRKNNFKLARQYILTTVLNQLVYLHRNTVYKVT